MRLGKGGLLEQKERREQLAGSRWLGTSEWCGDSDCRHCHLHEPKKHSGENESGPHWSSSFRIDDSLAFYSFNQQFY